MQKRLIQTKVYYKLSYSVWKETSHKPLKVAAAKKYFPNVYIIDTTFFDKCFLFYVITRRHYFFTNLLLPKGWRNCHVVFFETGLLEWSLQFIFVIFTITYNTANTKGLQQTFYFLNLLIVFFLLLQFVNVNVPFLRLCNFFCFVNFFYLQVILFG